jgi:hypothetical protein
VPPWNHNADIESAHTYRHTVIGHLNTGTSALSDDILERLHLALINGSATTHEDTNVVFYRFETNCSTPLKVWRLGTPQRDSASALESRRFRVHSRISHQE